MTLRVLALGTLAVSLFASSSSAEEVAGWLRDLDAAKNRGAEVAQGHPDRVHRQGMVLPLSAPGAGKS